jgi:hypothetical protein
LRSEVDDMGDTAVAPESLESFELSCLDPVDDGTTPGRADSSCTGVRPWYRRGGRRVAGSLKSVRAAILPEASPEIDAGRHSAKARALATTRDLSSQASMTRGRLAVPMGPHGALSRKGPVFISRRVGRARRSPVRHRAAGAGPGRYSSRPWAAHGRLLGSLTATRSVPRTEDHGLPCYRGGRPPRRPRSRSPPRPPPRPPRSPPPPPRPPP